MVHHWRKQIRTLVKSVQQEVVAPATELLLMYAARVQLVSTVIQPALAAGQWVLGDRHDLSSRAYQGGGRQIPDSLIDSIRLAVLGDVRPDLTLYLDIDPAIGLERARARGELDRIEQEQLAFFQRTRARYLQIRRQRAWHCGDRRQSAVACSATRIVTSVAGASRVNALPWLQGLQQQLGQLALRGQLHHALLFTGISGVGNTIWRRSWRNNCCVCNHCLPKPVVIVKVVCWYRLAIIPICCRSVVSRVSALMRCGS